MSRRIHPFSQNFNKIVHDHFQCLFGALFHVFPQAPLLVGVNVADQLGADPSVPLNFRSSCFRTFSSKGCPPAMMARYSSMDSSNRRCSTTFSHLDLVGEGAVEGHLALPRLPANLFHRDAPDAVFPEQPFCGVQDVECLRAVGLSGHCRNVTNFF